MKTNQNPKNGSPEVIQLNEVERALPAIDQTMEAYAVLERGIYAALETYSNVHRGSGHNSMVSTHLFEQAREIVLEHVGLTSSSFVVVFCTPRRAAVLATQLEKGSYQIVADRDFGLSMGVRAMAVQRKALSAVTSFQTGGGTTRLISKEWVIWAGAPDRFEAGTPAIINIIAFARALRMIRQSGKDLFLNPHSENLTASGILRHDELDHLSGKELLDALRPTLIGSGLPVPTVNGTRAAINLDNSASTPTFTPVWNAFRQTWKQPGAVRQEVIEQVKSVCARFLGAPLSTYEVIFTSNTTEAINLAAESVSLDADGSSVPVIHNSLMEHSSNDLPWRMVPGGEMLRLSVDAEGFFDPVELETLLRSYNQEDRHRNKRIRIVAISGASNVLGTSNNIAEISRIVHHYKALLLVDAAQLVAHRAIDMEGCGIDLLAFSAHKVYAPFGIGVLVVRKGLLNFNPGEMELIRSSGEENAGGIAALGKALILLQRIGMEVITKEEQLLTAKLLQGLAKIAGLQIYGIQHPESPRFAGKLGVVVFGIKNKTPVRIANQLALQGGIGVRYGCHCAHIIIKHLLNVSPFLERFQYLIQRLFPKFRFMGLVRVSLGIGNNAGEIETLIHTLGIIAGRKQSSAKGNSTLDQERHMLPEGLVKKQMQDFIGIRAAKVYNLPD